MGLVPKTGRCLYERMRPMLYYLLLLCVPVVSCCQSVAQKQYNLKTEKPNIILFSAFTSIIALCFFLITSRLQLNFDARLIPYSLGFAVSYAAAWVGTVFAVRYGLMAISSLIISCSLIFPTVYGVINGEQLTAKIVIGVALLMAALVLVNLRFERRDKFSMKWLMWVLIALVGNGICSIMQNMQKRNLGDSYAHEFMIIALAAASIMLLALSGIFRPGFIASAKICVPYSAANGVANALVNLMQITLIGNIPNTILYPTNAALGMVFTFLLAFLRYKERFSRAQYLGYILGMASIILLNI